MTSVNWREKWAECPTSVKWLAGGGLLSLVVFVVFVTGGVGTYYYLEDRLEAEVKDFLVVSSKDNDGYTEWEHNDFPDAVPLYADYYLWNLTNIEQLLTVPDTKPYYDLVGPFSYRKYIKKIAVDFVNSGKEVSYSEWNYYTYESEYSVPGDPSEMYITGMNPAYMTVLSTAGSEANLMTAAIGPTLAEIMNQLTSVFPALIIQQRTAMALPPIQTGIIQAIMNSQNITIEEATAAFYTEWANSTDPDMAIWGSLGVLSSNGMPSNLSESAAAALWNAGLPTLPTLVNANPQMLLVWLQAMQNVQQYRNIIMGSFLITDAQLNAIIAWMQKFQVPVATQIVQFYNLTSVADLGWLQWGTGEVTNMTSVRDLDPSNPLGLAGIPEVAIWSAQNAMPISFNVSTAKALLNGTYGLFSTANTVGFLQLAQQGNWAAIEATWGLSQQPAGIFAGYLQYVAGTFVKQVITTAINPLNTTNFLRGGGLFSTRTVQEWLWGMTDPLLKLLNQPNPTVAFVNNQTTEEVGYSQKNNSLYYTGKSDISKIGKYIEWQGLSELAAGNPWAEAEEVEGYYGDTFAPFLDRDDRLDVWVPEMLRNMLLRYTSQVTKYDITLWRYRLTDADFQPNTKFYQGIYGFANMTSSMGAPIYISKARMLSTPDYWRQKLDGVGEPGNIDDTYLDIEPITGYAMDVEKKLQVNMYLDNSTAERLNVFNTAVPKDIIYPIFYTDLNSEINEELADDFKNTVYRVLIIRDIVFWSGIAIGIFTFCLSLILIIIAAVLYRRSRVAYVNIPASLAADDYFPEPDADVRTPSRSNSFYS